MECSIQQFDHSKILTMLFGTELDWHRLTDVSIKFRKNEVTLEPYTHFLDDKIQITPFLNKPTYEVEIDFSIVLSYITSMCQAESYFDMKYEPELMIIQDLLEPCLENREFLDELFNNHCRKCVCTIIQQDQKPIPFHIHNFCISDYKEFTQALCTSSYTIQLHRVPEYIIKQIHNSTRINI